MNSIKKKAGQRFLSLAVGLITMFAMIFGLGSAAGATPSSAPADVGSVPAAAVLDVSANAVQLSSATVQSGVYNTIVTPTATASQQWVYNNTGYSIRLIDLRGSYTNEKTVGPYSSGWLYDVDGISVKTPWYVWPGNVYVQYTVSGMYKNYVHGDSNVEVDWTYGRTVTIKSVWW